MMLRKKTKHNAFKSCIISLLALVGILLACFLFCTVLFQLNQASVTTGSVVLNLLFG
jgi:uncharacterized protein YpmS